MKRIFKMSKILVILLVFIMSIPMVTNAATTIWYRKETFTGYVGTNTTASGLTPIYGTCAVRTKNPTYVGSPNARIPILKFGTRIRLPYENPGIKTPDGIERWSFVVQDTGDVDWADFYAEKLTLHWVDIWCRADTTYNKNWAINNVTSIRDYYIEL